MYFALFTIFSLSFIISAFALRFGGIICLVYYRPMTFLAHFQLCSH